MCYANDEKTIVVFWWSWRDDPSSYIEDKGLRVDKKGYKEQWGNLSCQISKPFIKLKCKIIRY